MLEKTVDGKYTLIGFKEKGDAFQSYLAHYHLLGNQVMVDIVHTGRLPGGAGPLRARLQPLPTLRHPSISRVFAWGEEEDYLFVVREFAHGSFLGELLQETGTLPPEQALGLMRRLVEGLGALHGRGIYYTGLNPHQVWIGRGGEAVFVRPGYSILLEREDVRFSREAAPYWAPEVISGGEGTRSSDIYSLGMMARRLLLAHKDDPDLWKVLREAGAHDPARRPTSARVFLERMEGAVSGRAPARHDGDSEGEEASLVSPGAGEGQPCEEVKHSPATPAAGEPVGLSPRDRLLRMVQSRDVPAASVQPVRRPGMGRLLKLSVAGVVIAAVILVVHLAGTASRTRQDTETIPAVITEEAPPEPQLLMPDLRGMDQAEARRLLQEMGLEVEMVSEPSNVVPEGRIIIQEPLRGEVMRKGHKVRIYVSTGPLQKQAAGLPAPARLKDIPSGDPLSGRGSATREPRGSGDPKRVTPPYQERWGHGA